MCLSAGNLSHSFAHDEHASAQAVQIVIEAALIPHAGGECRFAGVAEWGMAQVVREGDRFRQILVQAQATGDRSTDLGDFERVRQPSAMVVVDLTDQDLRLSH